MLSYYMAAGAHGSCTSVLTYDPKVSFSMHELFPGMVSGIGMLPQGLPTAKRPRVALDEVPF